MKRGYFITLEGVEGAGKSTVIQFAVEYLRQHKIDLVVTREFGGTEIAEKIREILLGHHNEIMTPDAELLLAFAARAQHLANRILPALEGGKWVLCDRFTDSSYAYQGAGRGIAKDRIEILENFVQGNLRPDFTLLLDIPPEIGFERIKNQKNLDRIESEEMQFFWRVRNGYLQRANQEKQRFRIVDASVAQDKVIEQLQVILSEIISKFNNV